jgi:hypothetical protein
VFDVGSVGATSLLDRFLDGRWMIDSVANENEVVEHKRQRLTDDQVQIPLS